MSNMNNATHSKMTQMVGTMTFDPAKMCWISSVDEEDPFTGFDEEVMNINQDSDTVVLTNPQKGIRIDASGEFIVGKEFDLSTEFIEKLRSAEEMHWAEMKKWLPKATRGRSLQNEDRFGLVRQGRTDKRHSYDYLYNIRKMIES